MVVTIIDFAKISFLACLALRCFFQWQTCEGPLLVLSTALSEDAGQEHADLGVIVGVAGLVYCSNLLTYSVDP